MFSALEKHCKTHSREPITLNQSFKLMHQTRAIILDDLAVPSVESHFSATANVCTLHYLTSSLNPHTERALTNFRQAAQADLQ